MIRLLRLVTGQLVLSRVSDVNEEGYIQLEKPLELVLRPGPQGQTQMGLVPYGSLGELLPAFETVPIHMMHLLHPPQELPKRLEDLYLSSSSGIQLSH